MDFRNHFFYTRCEVFGSVMPLAVNTEGLYRMYVRQLYWETQVAACAIFSSSYCLIQLKAAVSERKARK